jgi:hypothetical protein
MSKWTSMGHGMRRRAGLPNNHHESAGANMRERNHPTHHEAYAAAQAVGSSRIPVGDAIYQVTPDMSVYGGQAAEMNTGQLQGALIPKKSTQAGDPTGMGTKQNRVNVPYEERHGAQYRITVPFTPTIDPAAGPTMRSAKVVPSVAGRQNPNFQSGIQYSNI